MLITVIVPFYKSEKYIENCLKSIVNQTYKNLEILLINDESPDSSKKICENLMKKDSRIKIIDKKNGGVSSARNLGIDSANGDFITFVDSDDEIELDLYERMVKYIKDDTDIICCGIKRCTSKGEVLFESNMSYEKENFTPFDAMRACLENKEIGFNVYTKLFRKELFNGDNLIRFPEGRLMEEAFVLPYLFIKGKLIRHCKYAGYKYFIRENSYTTKTLNEECFYIFDTIDDYEKNLDNLYPGINKYVRKWKYINCINLYRTALLDKKNIKKNVFKRIKREFNRIWVKALFSNTILLREKLILLETKLKIVVLRKKRRKNGK